jgi:phthiocerol/phenolphthiocerol synthesis type-I polyketide synthase E
MSENEVEFNTTGLEIAVIGMVCRFPQAKNIDEFWQNLIAGKECIAFFADEELEEAGVPSELLENPLYIKAYGWLEDIEYFDASFFGYTPIEAQTMDPQLCIFHECTLEALENAGYDCYSYNRSIGLYAGASASANWQVRALLSRNVGILGGFPAKQLHDKDFLATRVANKLNLKGPAMTIDTACSTSLVAIHLACQGLISGDCDLALAGGITIPVVNKEGYMYQEGMIASPDGHTRAFAARAKGSNFGNGVGIVVLKRLEEAIEDRDTIYAVIKGTAINNDGSRKATYTAPSIEGQSEAVRTAYQVAEVEPETIGYIETHGTGTSLGDPVEIEALNSAFDTDKKQFCRIGSVKTNLGHLEIAAGVAGFIKTVLILKHQLIPPSLFFDKPNPKIDFENSPFIVNAGLTEWKRGKYPLRAGVSSLGIGGTNAHVILEEAPKTEGTGGLAPLPDALLSQGYQLILLSAKTSSALDKMTQNLADHLKNNPGINLADAAYTLQVGRRRYQHRRMLLGAHVDETIDILASPDTNSGKIKTHCSEQDNRPIVFMFPGLGSQYVNMGRRLYEREPVFRQEMDHCFKILESLLDYDLKEILYPQNSVSEVSGASNYNSARLAGIGDSPLERGTPDPEKGGGCLTSTSPKLPNR